MGEIADMMLDGTMDFETGEFNFDGSDGPGFPMTGADAARWKRDARTSRRERRGTPLPGAAAVTAKTREKIEALGELRQNDAYHWQVRRGRVILADWWPHKNKYRIAGRNYHGNESDFLRALAKSEAA